MSMPMPLLSLLRKQRRDSLSSLWRLLPGSTVVTAPLRIQEDGFSPHAEELSAMNVILR